MKRLKTVFSLPIVMCLSLFAQRAAGAAEPAYRLDVKGMHCAGCAAKVAGKLKSLEGVASANVDAVKGVAVVTPKAAIKLSPKALWEVVEKSGYKPTKLVCPAGTFTAKPRS